MIPSSVEHEAVWYALERQGIDRAYIEVLKRLYASQVGRIRVADQTSRAFKIARGTKQGDPLSTLLFNAVLEDAFRDVREKWIRRKCGIEMSEGAECRLSNLCFADDVLLLASNPRELTEMLKDIIDATAKRGLEIHEDKTKVLTNAGQLSSRRIPEHLLAGTKRIQVLEPAGTVKWLGRKVSFQDPHECELNNRIAGAWSTFTKHKEELTSRKYRLQDRLKLFGAVVTPTVLYGCETWTLNQSQQRRLRSVQRKMLRNVLNARRRRVEATSSWHSHSEDDDVEEQEVDALEPWAEFLTRTTRWTEEQLRNAGQQEWLETWRKRQWQWAGRLVSKDAGKWSAVTTRWQPLLHSSAPRGRAPGRPKKRWDQDMVDFLAQHAGPGDSWQERARDEADWKSLTPSFVEHTCNL